MARWLIVFMILVPYLASAAQDPNEPQPVWAPQRPSYPVGLIRKAPPSYPHCERYFMYQGSRYECDSNLGSDGARLRDLMQDTPQAIVEMDHYLASRKQARISGVLITVSVIMLGLGALWSRSVVGPSGEVTPGGYVTLSGVALGLGSAAYSLFKVRSSEQHLSRAVDVFNQAYPDRPIELRLSEESESHWLK